MIPFFQPRSDLPISADSTGRYLPLLVAVMVFLAVLALAAALAVGGVLDDWRQDVAGTVTVQIVPASGPDPVAARAETDRRVEQVLAVLRAQSFIVVARPLEEAQLVGLLEPWLGSSDLVRDLPLPRLIDVQVAEGARPDLAGLARQLREEVPGAALDDHQVWLSGIIDLAEGFSLLGIVVVGLVAAALAATVIHATRLGLEVHRDQIEVLHLIGAHDRYIAQQFAARMVGWTLEGGLVGLVLAMPTLMLVAWLAQDLEQGLLPPFSLGFWGWMALALVPASAALLALVTARVTVRRTLRRML
ncbi:cell division protein FtsX [Caenispirillum bisanense]|uniref:Cell division transport system permease protein n=1 Tax=Caenispirillum bisanense TaxID=414052 RepID=A0A286GH21_9PROT|nr:cell division protein [Caenispirillum bisanense]SOD94808.1 cell division transport system permease protein [Caenispirillum bisanense]